ncbi:MULTISPECIES: LysM peptidoglycan-binding domain-containing protein [unclassified Planococcus (in: firmicutes)]|uniref:C40 family peptidase n=1 Tax=unclassified Planococcus (in: firmicutes) TaxID=2662419 RepID=UPI000C32BE63|nr:MULTISPECIES: LysM peptidoglycan-binding domain-containing protein [unclassified Planococcus (in: firmicutes)]AUD12759.1 peptidoglycan endopeptidase [Planococcus sp. MB-3u-03]PKG46712.1 peptidoglycan endopeptidase [Planococcus sp. Urea-trap-24]PKG89557.1 peptidoglycan endopeptidase [Planococcus sp. Urea-3u-39]PKH36134.1 peptidoglycan endopeptidase [Planococcus sp. MB-3u-09]
MKKLIGMAITAGVLSLALGAADTEASSYKIKPGDTLWKVASSNDVSVANLKTWNRLSTDAIYPNQVLRLTSPAAASTPAPSAPAAPAAAKTSTYTVKAGDTLYKVAKAHATSVAKIQQLNNLSNSTIHVGQKLKVSGTASAVVASPSPAPAAPPAQANTTTYRVVSGDTLSKISRSYKVSVTQLMSWNNLSTSNIRVGQVLKIQGGTAPAPSPVQVSKPAASSKAGQVLSIARTQLGVPYAWGGTTSSGFDCSGYLYYVYNRAGITIPRTNTIGYYASSFTVSSPQPGDLVFFKNTYRPGISHVGIYVGNNSFIHAGGDRVQITSLNDSYWGKHFDSYKRLNAMR